MAAISNNSIAQAIYEALKGKTMQEHPETYKQTVEFLSKRGLLSKAPDILERLEKIINKEEGKVEAKVYLARNLSDPERKELRESISRRYGNKEVLLEEHIDDKLLGGIKIEIEDETIDLSLKGKIKKLQEHLTKSI